MKLLCSVSRESFLCIKIIDWAYLKLKNTRLLHPAPPDICHEPASEAHAEAQTSTISNSNSINNIDIIYDLKFKIAILLYLLCLKYIHEMRHQLLPSRVTCGVCINQGLSRQLYLCTHIFTESCIMDAGMNRYIYIYIAFVLYNFLLVHILQEWVGRLIICYHSTARWPHLVPVEDVLDGCEARADPRLRHNLLDPRQLLEVEVPLPLEPLQCQPELH